LYPEDFHNREEKLNNALATSDVGGTAKARRRAHQVGGGEAVSFGCCCYLCGEGRKAKE
jgi:hypothetical protein